MRRAIIGVLLIGGLVWGEDTAGFLAADVPLARSRPTAK